MISILEDRRILFAPVAYEIPQECIDSASKARGDLTDQINTSGIGAELAAILKQIRKLFAVFMETRITPQPTSYGPDQLSVALGQLRAAVGERIGILARMYDLEVDEDLASTIPDDGSWFFEKFSEDGY